MAIGISTACYYPLETEEALIEVGRAGAPVSEIFFNCPRELKPSFIDLLNDIRDSYGVRISAIHTFTAAADSYMFYSNYQRRLEDSLDFFETFCEAAAGLNAQYIIMHGDKKVGKLPDEIVAERFLMLDETAEKYGVCLLQENVNGFRSADPEFIRNLRINTNDKSHFCFDIKQAIRSGHTPEEIISAMGDKICHVHISDNSASSDCLLPSRGRYDFGNLFSLLKQKNYSGDYMIEIYRHAYQEYHEIENSLRFLNNFPL